MKIEPFSTKNYGIDFSLLLLRITFGGLLFFDHGIGKIHKLSEDPVKFMDFLGLGPEASLYLVVFAEVACALFVAFGLFTRLGWIPLIINFIVVLFVAQSGAPFKEIELPLMFLLSFIILFITGPGKYSIDSVLEKNRLP
jgi:putative oxidoreductase